MAWGTPCVKPSIKVTDRDLTNRVDEVSSIGICHGNNITE